MIRFYFSSGNVALSVLMTAASTLTAVVGKTKITCFPVFSTLKGDDWLGQNLTFFHMNVCKMAYSCCIPFSNVEQL